MSTVFIPVSCALDGRYRLGYTTAMNEYFAACSLVEGIRKDTVFLESIGPTFLFAP